jgi:hypothetical protein
MLDNLKIAVKRQKKLIIIFLLTIFLPSVALSIFGVRAIRNERFRLVQQLEDEHRSDLPPKYRSRSYVRIRPG